MAKKEQYGMLAEQYYVEHNMPISGIAKRLNINEKTLHSWKREGKWDEKRAKFLHSKYSCHSALYELVNLLVKNAIEKYKTEGVLPEAKELYFIKDMAEKLPKMKSFENNLAEEQIQETAEVKENSFEKEDIVRKIFEAMTDFR